MSIKSKIAGALAVLTLAGALAVPTSSAQARGGWGFGAAVLGGVVAGAAIASTAPYGGYYVVDNGYRRCRWERQYDSYGFYVGTAKVCRYYY